MLNNVRRLSRQLFAYGTADVFVLAISFLLLPIYTRVLSPREYGALALLLVVEAVLRIVSRWGLDAALLRLYYECPDEERRKTLAGTIAGFIALANGLISALLLVLAVPMNLALFDSLEFIWPYRLLIVNGFLSTFLFLPFTLLRIQERARLFATLNFSQSFGTIVLRLLFVVFLRLGLFGILFADVVMTLVLLIAMSRMLRSMMVWHISMAQLREALRYGFPYVPSGVLTHVMGMGDRFVLGMFMPLRDVGLYLIAASVAALIKYFPVAFDVAWTPFAYDSMQRRDAPELFARMATYAFAILAVLLVALSGLAPPLMELVLPPTYREVGPLVPILALAMAVQTVRSVPGTSLNIAKKTSVYPTVTAVGAILSTSAYFALIPRFGTYGAAFALLISQILTTALMIYLAQRVYRIPYELGRLAKVVAASAVTYGAMMTMASGSTWRTVAIRLGLLALFPVGLMVLRFLRPHELADVRKLIASLRRTAEPVASLP
ncbi:MAG TPA: oligosaccharide flippase family protein [Vicinamibacterales bacterium]|nr:oligosaccharide flippase family protein [Vicinamibacterales bacterium]